MKSDSEKAKKKKTKKRPSADNCYFEWLANTEKRIFEVWDKKS